MNQQDKQFITQFLIIIAALVVFTIAMFFVGRYFMSVNQVDYGPLLAEEVDNRIKPMGEASSSQTEKPAKTQKTASSSTSASSGGKMVFSSVCSRCHVSGMLGAPRISDERSWKFRLEQGKQTLYEHAINGVGAMPAKGGSGLPDSQVKAAVDYMVAQVSGGEEQQAKASSGKTQKTASSSTSAQSSGEQAFSQVCSRCHTSGMMGAPRISDSSAWKSRLAQGKQTLYQHAINGIGAMPAKGGSNLPDSQVKAAVDYIVAQVSGGGGGAQAQASSQSSGQQAFSQVCSRCHTSGMMGAPRISDSSAWKSRLAQGKQTLYQHAINGIGAMPAKGGSNLPDSQVKAAVDYIVAQVSGGSGGGGGGAQAQPTVTAKSTAQGESVYTSMCSTCHNSGALGAPMVTSAGAWKARLMQGKQMLYSHAINGIGAMPAKGGHSELSDAQVKAAVDHIIATVSSGGGGQQQSSQAQAKPIGAAQATAQGESIYTANCSTCHNSGALGAPMITAKAAWKARLVQGTELLYNHAINGIGAMPAKGGHPQLSDTQVKEAVDYIIATVSGNAQAQGQSGVTAKSTAQGESVYTSMCSTCHNSGALGAPMVTNAGAWKARLMQGKQMLYSHAINGIGAMPAKGGHSELSEAQVKAAVDHIIATVSGGGG